VIKMKRIVNGLLYDTEKAEIISKYKTSHNSTYDWWLGIQHQTTRYEILYRTKKGRYFLLKQSRTLGKCGDTIVPLTDEGECNETIVPLTDEEAFSWLAEHDPDKAIELFPEKHIEEA